MSGKHDGRQLSNLESGGGGGSVLRPPKHLYCAPPSSGGRESTTFDTSSSSWGLTSNNTSLTMLLHSLSMPALRRFAMAEFFYSTVDRAYFNQNTFQESLDAVGLSHVQKLTRTEWNRVRAFIGRRRRMSPALFTQERQRLREYRQVVRDIQQGRIVEPPPEFTFEVPTPLVVGQAVTAYHEKAKLLACGHILTCDYERGQYRVQFERPELSSLICQDSDIASNGASSLLLIGEPSRKQRLQDNDISIHASISGFHHLPSPINLSSLLLHHRHSATLRTMEMEEQEEEGEERMENSENDMQQQVPKQQQQAQLMIFTLKMLDRKDILVAALQKLNQQGEAEVAAATTSAASPSRSSGDDKSISSNNSSSGSSGSNSGGLLLYKTGSQSRVDLSGFEFTSTFKQKYARAIDALQHTNVLLSSALEGLQKLTQHQRQVVADKQSTEGEMYCLQLYNGMLVSRVVRETVEGARAEGQKACKRHIAAKYGYLLSLSIGKYADNNYTNTAAAAAAAVSGKKQVTLEEGGLVQGVIEAGATLLMVIRRCAEERHKCLSRFNEGESEDEEDEEEEVEEEVEKEKEEKEEDKEDKEDEEDEEADDDDEEGGASTVTAAMHPISAMEVEQCMGLALLELKRQLVLIDGAGRDSSEEERKEEDGDEGKEEEEEEAFLQEKRCLVDTIECIVGLFKDELLTSRGGWYYSSWGEKHDRGINL
ncbi:protein always early 3-like isoform x1 [Nannochloropsis oceanica]